MESGKQLEMALELEDCKPCTSQTHTLSSHSHFPAFVSSPNVGDVLNLSISCEGIATCWRKQLARFLANQPHEVVEDMEIQKGSADENSRVAFDKATEAAGEHHLERSPNSDKLYRAVFEEDDDLDAKRVKAYQKNLNGITAAVKVCQDALDEAIEEARPWDKLVADEMFSSRVDA